MRNHTVYPVTTETNTKEEIEVESFGMRRSLGRESDLTSVKGNDPMTENGLNLTGKEVWVGVEVR